jgi:hypothetical protein
MQQPEVKVGLSMYAKKEVVEQIRNRYQKATRKEKTAILNEFIKTTGYTNKKYAIRKLSKKSIKESIIIAGGKAVRIKPDNRQRPKNRQGKKIYTEEVISSLRKIWAFYWYKCGKDLAPIIREQMPFLEIHRKPHFHITPEIRDKLLKISPAQIDRCLKADKAELRGKGFSGTRLGEAALLKRIPVRTHYSDSEREIPGFMQIDTVHHCNDNGFSCGFFT